ELVRRDDGAGAHLDDAPFHLEVLELPPERLGILLELLPGAPELGGRGRLEESDRGELERLGSARADVDGIMPREPLLGQAPARRAGLTAQPTRPPAIVALRSAAPWDKALDACATSPAALTRSTASPVNGRTPRVTGGRTNAEAPQAPSRSGKRKPAYPKDWKAAQPSHTPTGPTGLCCPAGGREGSNVASAIRPNPAIASARIPLTSLSQRSVRGRRLRGGRSPLEARVAIRPPG